MVRSRLRKVARFRAALLVCVLACTALAAPNSAPIKWSTVAWQRGVASAQDANGKSVALGLNPGLQNTLVHLLTRAKPIAGAATLVDARTGQVLAAAEIGKSTGGSLLFEPLAPAASLFKIVTTAALYENTEVTPTTRVCTQGGQHDVLREHLARPTGPDVVCGPFAHALGVSRNAAYAQLATEKLMRHDLVAMAHSLGFGAPLALDSTGSLGTVQIPYNDLSFARTAAGFENSRLSVMGGAQLALTVASGGVVKPMHFQTTLPVGPFKRAFSQRTARRIRDAMEVTIHSGTARSSFVTKNGHSTVGPVQVAGKTGTIKPTPQGPTSSWFIGFAPSEDPRVIVSVLLQNPDEWVQKGHQVGRDLLRAYLDSVGVRGFAPH